MRAAARRAERTISAWVEFYEGVLLEHVLFVEDEHKVVPEAEFWRGRLEVTAFVLAEAIDHSARALVCRVWVAEAAVHLFTRDGLGVEEGDQVFLTNGCCAAEQPGAQHDRQPEAPPAKH